MGKRVAYMELNQQPTVTLYRAQNNPSYHESSCFRCVQFHAGCRTFQTHHSGETPVFPLPLRAPSFHYRVPSLTSPTLLCTAPPGAGVSFTIFSSSASRTLTCTRWLAGRQAGSQAMLILKTIECSEQLAPPVPSPLPQNTPLLVGKHTFTQIFLPIWSGADGALRQRRV